VYDETFQRTLRLLRAVHVGDFDLTCEDVDGKNWFDACQEIMGELTKAQKKRCNNTGCLCPDCWRNKEALS
jgi:hypothetical protein